MNRPTLSLKQFGVWVTALTDEYKYNPFLRTTVHIIALQFLMALIMVGIFAWGLEYVQTHTLSQISQHIQEAISGQPDSMTSLPDSIAAVRARTLEYVFTCLVLLSLAFGYLLARFALRPTRDSLQFQKRFIGNVAHEIRTPLAIMKTNTEVALLDPDLPPSIRAGFGDILIEVDRISETINNLLTFNTLTRPKPLKMEPLDLGKIVEEVIERHQALAVSRGIELKGQIATDRLVLGNASALDQVITNLIKNAVNYTPAHQSGTVLVIVGRNYRDGIELSIADDGMGIAQKDLYHILEPFYRADTSRARNVGTGSSGLGLAIVNEIVRLHRGIIHIKSAVGKGTTFKITLPSVETLEVFESAVSDTGKDVHEVSLDFS